MIDFSSLELQPDSFIDDGLRLKVVDLLYKVNFNGKTGYLYILIEHTSTSQKLLPFRMFKYALAIMEKHMERTGDTTLPLVLPLIFYTGSRRFRHSTNIYDLFGKYKKQAQLIYNRPFTLVDLSQISDEDLEKTQWFQVLGLLMKHTRSSKILPVFEKVLKIMKSFSDSDLTSYLKLSLSYVWETARTKNWDQFRKLIGSTLRDKEEMAMTIAEQLRQEGREEAQREAMTIAEQLRQEGVQLVASNLLKMGLEIDAVAQGTGLSIHQVRALQENRNVDLQKLA